LAFSLRQALGFNRLLQDFSICEQRKNLTGHGQALLKLSTFCNLNLSTKT